MSRHKHNGQGYLKLLGFCLLLLFVAACAGNGEGLDENGNPFEEIEPPVPMPEAPTFSDVQGTVFVPFCFCHVGASAPLGLVLDTDATYDLLVNTPSAQRPELFRVEPGNPDESYIIHKLEGGPDIVGFRMPAIELGASAHLSQETINRIRDWITAGALDN